MKNMPLIIVMVHSKDLDESCHHKFLRNITVAGMTVPVLSTVSLFLKAFCVNWRSCSAAAR